MFLTSVIELKLHRDTMFEWQKHTQSNADTPHYQELLDFIDLQAQASETSQSQSARKSIPQRTQPSSTSKTIPSFATLSSTKSHSSCVLCEKEKHILYIIVLSSDQCRMKTQIQHFEKAQSLSQLPWLWTLR